MTIREYATRRLHQCGMAPREAEQMLDWYARTGEGSIVGWTDTVPGLSRPQYERIDQAAVRYLNARGLSAALPEKPPARDGRMRATGDAP